MMQCPACSTPLTSGEARCGACHALVNPPAQGSSALAPRLVTPQNVEGFGQPKSLAAAPESTEGVTSFGTPKSDAPGSDPKSADDAWRLEVLERVRKRRQVRSHALPLFVEGQGNSTPPAALAPPVTEAFVVEEPGLDELGDPMDYGDPLSKEPAPDALASLEMPFSAESDLAGSPGGGSLDEVFDFRLRPVEAEAPPATRGRNEELPSQSLVERSRPTLVSGPAGTRSLVADLPLVEPTRFEPVLSDLPPRAAPKTGPAVASMNDRAQAALIDLGIWSAMCAVAFYFASRIARASILGLGSAWSGLTLFAVVLAAAYILFFGGLSGATPGKIACGIQVRRNDGSSIGPLASLVRGFLGIAGIALFGLGIWPAFWDKNRRTLHDRATQSRVTTV